MNILLIEDEQIIHDTLLDNLLFEGYHVDSAYDGKTGLELASTGKYDLIVLDLMLPGMNGMDILKKIRNQQDDVPIIIVSAKTEEFTKLEGFREGADDYVCKPFSLPVLLARIKAVAKRRVNTETVQEIKIGNGTFHLNQYSFEVDGIQEKCTKYEVLILKLLSSVPGKIYSRSDILHYAWGSDVFPTDRTIDNYILKLRKKLERCYNEVKPNLLESIYGVGYKLNLENKN